MNALNERLKPIDLQQRFPSAEKIPHQSLKEFYQQFDPQLKETTFRWMLFELKKKREPPNLNSAKQKGPCH